MTGIDAAVKMAVPTALTAVVADDYQILLMGDEKITQVKMVKAHAAAADAFNEAHLPTEGKKMALLATTRTALRGVVARAPHLGVAQVKTTRNVGYDFTLMKGRSMGIFAARYKKAVVKSKKVIKIKRANIDTRLITTASLNSMVCWGADCLGASPQQIRDRRRLIHCSVSANTMGRSATIDFALAKGKVRNLDPSYSLTTAPIYALALAVWDRWCPQEWIMRVWSSAFRVASKPKFQLECCERSCDRCCSILCANWVVITCPWGATYTTGCCDQSQQNMSEVDQAYGRRCCGRLAAVSVCGKR